MLSPGVLSLIQDWGRYGQRQIGLANAGPMDEHAYLWANKLLNNNPHNSSTIEITLGMAKFESQIYSTIAIAGAQMNFKINNEPKQNWTTHDIKPGDQLSFASCSRGLRSYLAIAQGFEVKPIFASTATVVREHLGGLNGEALRKSDVICAKPKQTKSTSKSVPTWFIPSYHDEIVLNVIPGYQYEQFSITSRQCFVASTFILSQRMDRMGCRLTGEKIHSPDKGIISEGIAYGSIQIPADGQPLILLKDSGTIGGYPKIGCVARLDLNKLAQCQAGTKIKFRFVERAPMRKKLIEFLDYFNIH